MKKLNIIFAILTLTIFTVSCETNFDDYDPDRDTTIGFTKGAGTIIVPDGGEKTLELDIFVSDVASADRTFNIITVPGDTNLPNESYTFEPTVTIPANDRFGVIAVTGFGISLPEQEGFLTLQVEPSADYVSGNTIAIEIK